VPRLLSVVLLALLMAVVPAKAATVTILALGDSLTAGYGLPPDDAFPVKLEAALKAKGHDVRVVNAGVSGDTSAAGRDRLDWVLTDDVDAVIVELGANDALRGIPANDTQDALKTVLLKLKDSKRTVLLAGMKAPRNLGPDYVEHFDAIYPDLAESQNVLLYPFFLAGVAANPSLNQEDGMHPNARGVDVIVARILPMVEELIVKVDKK
jgi:acyl-CoA thioesterase-1